MATVPAKLLLASGECFEGQMPASLAGSHGGEVVFNTGMVGYVESMTDPSYAGQILAFTYPLMGNYGVPDPEQWESSKIQTSGIIISSLSAFQYHFQAKQSLLNWCEEQGVPILMGVDTRALTKALRQQGVVPGIITSEFNQDIQFNDVNQTNLVASVSIAKPITEGDGSRHIIAIDCGIKRNIKRCLRQYPWRITYVPYDYDFSEMEYDGVFISNGPGDPEMCAATIVILQKILKKQKPIFGICLGAQLLGLAVGAKTYKLTFGHRAQNQPCMELETGKCFLTSQNHGYAVDAQSLPNDWLVTFRSLNDDTVQGIAHKTLPYFAVQFHPEASPGPLDTQWLFDKFYKMVKS